MLLTSDGFGIGMWNVLGGVLTVSSMLREFSSSDCVSGLKLESVSAYNCVSGSLSGSVSLSDSCFGLKVLHVCGWRVRHLLLHLLDFTGHDFLLQLLVV